jgi:hypothetical protein
MFNRLFGKPKEQANAGALATLDKLNEVSLLSTLPFVFEYLLLLLAWDASALLRFSLCSSC